MMMQISSMFFLIEDQIKEHTIAQGSENLNVPQILIIFQTPWLYTHYNLSQQSQVLVITLHALLFMLEFCYK